MNDINELVDALVSQYVARLSDYNAGLSIEALKRKYNVNKIAKLGSNENPFGTANSVKKSLEEIGNLAYYPDPGCNELKSLLSHKMGCSTSQIVIGNGSEEIINMICHAFLEVNDDVLTVIPSFGLHIIYPQSYGANVITSSMTKSLEFDVDDLVEKLKKYQPKLFFIASPSNPVGCTLSSQDIEILINSQSARTIFVFDEAYFEFAFSEQEYVDVYSMLVSSNKPFILLRTLSKAYSLAGIRVGYAICGSDNIALYLNKVRLPFNVNRLAQRAAAVALTDKSHLEMTLQWNKQARGKMFLQLVGLGLNPIHSKGNFLFFCTDYPSIEMAEHLLKKGVIIKPWTEEGYTNYIRVSIGNSEENEHFIESLMIVINEMKGQ